MRRVMSRLSVLVGGAAMGLAVLAGPATAHDTLLGSDPARDAVLDTSPTSVTLRFNAVVGNPTVIVADASGNPHQQGEATVTDRTVTQSVNELPGGVYLVNYRVISSDGHPISGQVPFTVGGDQVTIAPPGTVAPAASTSAGDGGMTVVWYVAGGVVLVGLVGFLTLGSRFRRGGADAS